MADFKTIVSALSDAPPWLLDEVQSLLEKSNPDSAKGQLVEPGLSVFKYKGSRFWHARVTYKAAGVKDLRKSTGETDLEKAKLKAKEIKTAFFAQAEKGVVLEGRAFTLKSIAEKVVKEIQSSKVVRSTHPDYIQTIERYIIPALGHHPIRAVDQMVLRDYFNDVEVRSKTRIVIHRSCFKKIFDYAVLNRIMQQRDVPKIPVVDAEDQEDFRDAFDNDDFSVIVGNMDRFIAASRKKITRSYRELLFPYLVFLLWTGIRPGKEPLNLKYYDLLTREQEGHEILLAQIRKGKTAKDGGREVVLDQYAIVQLIAAANVRNGVEKTDIDDVMRSYHSQYIFRPLNQKLPPFEKVWGQYMDFIGDKLKRRYTLYSTRHTYINWALARGVPHAVIAQNCGNSVTTIEKYYQKMSSQLNARQLIFIESLSLFKPKTKKKKR